MTRERGFIPQRPYPAGDPAPHDDAERLANRTAAAGNLLAPLDCQRPRAKGGCRLGIAALRRDEDGTELVNLRGPGAWTDEGRRWRYTAPPSQAGTGTNVMLAKWEHPDLEVECSCGWVTRLDVAALRTVLSGIAVPVVP